ncbi:hypothetical protein E4U35_002029 [Claviceps purpurea]|nr:hypothetical protein E4U27_001553 [Claviceps purpurea]KAG6211705.1 hypothetical protein E4U35_002029 [Claviceps purpurea]KAG6282132.1 hypothetical protein E4U48_005155 [Claviceps purpurea]
MLEVLVGGASECCTSFYDTDGPQEPGVLHGSEGDVEASGRPTVGQFVKVGSELLEFGVCHLQVLRAPVRVEENQNEVLEYLCHRPESSSAVRCPGGIKVPRAHVRYPCPLRREPIFVDDVARILDHLDLIFLNPNRGSRARKAFANLKMTHTGFQEFRTNFYELAHGGGICENLKEKFCSFYFRRPLPRAGLA